MKYDFKQLIRYHRDLGQFVETRGGNLTINFDDSKAVQALNKALLFKLGKLDFYDVPEGYLFPSIPGRLAYIDWIHESIEVDHKTTILDIGVGANCIYPFLGALKYKWKFIGTEAHPSSYKSAKFLLQYNPKIGKKVSLRKPAKGHIFHDVLRAEDFVHATMCNPPFFKSETDYQKAHSRRNSNNQSSNAVGEGHELWTNGGELQFISQMIEESKAIRHQVGLFSSLISSKRNLDKLLRNINMTGFIHEVDEIQIGRKSAHILSWNWEY